MGPGNGLGSEKAGLHLATPWEARTLIRLQWCQGGTAPGDEKPMETWGEKQSQWSLVRQDLAQKASDTQGVCQL